MHLLLVVAECKLVDEVRFWVSELGLCIAGRKKIITGTTMAFFFGEFPKRREGVQQNSCENVFQAPKAECF